MIMAGTISALGPERKDAIYKVLNDKPQMKTGDSFLSPAKIGTDLKYPVRKCL